MQTQLDLTEAIDAIARNEVKRVKMEWDDFPPEVHQKIRQEALETILPAIDILEAAIRAQIAQEAEQS